ncbi:MAG: 3-phosphoshikimate 1-carboxyvinyltransferase [Actinomycetota bacterium]|jgi:3-phosphoshikimate 1-carboxyvinyltransferase|nr:3-phosphoshikimate 1-carboxyvinyltransferase [Actinomycetota bacterium]
MRYHAREAAGPLSGTLRLPGDKSISHRAILFAAASEGTSRLTGVLDGADVRSTIGAVSLLGAEVAVDSARVGLDVTVTGWGESGPISPSTPMDCGNSGTTSRLLLGLLAGWDVTVTLVGDESLSERPMARVTVPLAGMGAEFTTRDGRLPITVHGGAIRCGIHTIPVASAQVKTALLLAGLRGQGRTVVTEPAPSRDHTETMLPAFGVEVGRDLDELSCWIEGPTVPTACDMAVPADPSSAAFMVAAAILVPGSDVVLPDVCLNPTRTGFLRVLHRMGADIGVDVRIDQAPERVGTVHARYSGDLVATVVESQEIPSLIDEVPILAVIASQAVGTTRFEDVGELRVKESDRLKAVHEGLLALGVEARSGPDWLEVDGRAELSGAELDSLGDHRLAMAWAVAASIASAPVVIDRFEAVDISYPGFSTDLASLSF